jgi:hypothetical protein
VRTPSKRTLVIGAVVGLAAGGAVGGALAASGTFDPGQQRQAFPNDAAGRLGVSSSKLEDAVKQAAVDRVDAALAAGQITQAQADAMKAAIDAGKLPLGMPGLGFGFRGGGPGLGRGGLGFRGDVLGAAAGYLGLSETDLRAQLQSGKSLSDVAKAQGKSVDGLEQAIVSAVKAQLDQAVKSGRLTSDQESQILSALKSKLDDLVNRTPMTPSQGGFGGRFRFAPGGFHAPFPASPPRATFSSA